MKQTWKTVRVYIDVKARSDITEKEIRKAIELGLNLRLIRAHLRGDFGSGPRLGRIEVKAKSRVDAAERLKRDRSLTQTGEE